MQVISLYCSTCKQFTIWFWEGGLFTCYKIPVHSSTKMGKGSGKFPECNAVVMRIPCTISFFIFLYISAHYTIQKIKMTGIDIWILSFWYSVFGAIISIVPSAIFETMKLPSTGLEWAFFTGHCLGGAMFAIAVIIAQQFASLMTVSLALGFQLVCYFFAQYIFFHESSTKFGLIIESTGAVLVIISAAMDPMHKVIINLRQRWTQNYSAQCNLP